MNTQEVFQIIHQNGIGQNIRCFFSSENKEDERRDRMSIINNYKYQNGIIKLYVDNFHFKEHEKNLIIYPNCEFLINKEQGKQLVSIRLFCKFVETENQYIYVRISNIKYTDDTGKIVTEKINNSV